jgi:cyanophycin synthetase
VKPLDGNQERGVSLNVSTSEDLARAFQLAREHSTRVIVEQLFQGRDYRILVVNGGMVAASEKIPARVTSDGRHTIRELIEIANQDPRRGRNHAKALSCIEPDAIMMSYLGRHGRSLDSVPDSRETVFLRDSANLSTGGEARDVTDEVHPEFKVMFERAARLIGLDICGLVVVLPNILQPPAACGGIIEVNAAPGIRMHHFPSEGKPRDAASAIVDMLYPNGSNGRIPILSITGTNGKTTVARMIAHVISGTGKTVGCTSTDGITIGGKLVAKGDMTGPWSAGVVLNDPSIEVAVLETARG